MNNIDNCQVKNPLQLVRQPASFSSQRLCYKYAIAAFIFFGIQGIAGLGGALELVFPDLPIPIPHSAGRAFHLNISVLWPLIGLTGSIYYFFCQEAEREIYSQKLINLNFWLFLITILATLSSLLLGFNDGREYLEAIMPLKLAVLSGCLILCYNIVRTFKSYAVPKSRATLIGIVAGCLSLVIFYLPNIISYVNPAVEELIKFWYIHLWEEMSMELIGTGLLTALLLAVTGVPRKKLEQLIYLDILLATVAGVLATGHHYYWLGVPAIWFWVGGIFSTIQTIPAFLLLFSMTKSINLVHFNDNLVRFRNLPPREKVTILLVASSVFYHIVGASILGLTMAYPYINRYTHGTYIVSAHSHLALFGVFGFLVLALCFYIIFTEIAFTLKDYRLCLLATLSLNCGLLIMGISLLAAGWLQIYLLHIAGLDIRTVNDLIRPYLIIRLIGGLIFSAGSSLFTLVILKTAWRFKTVFKARAQTSSYRIQMQQLQQDIGILNSKLKTAEALLLKIKRLHNGLALIKQLYRKKLKE